MGTAPKSTGLATLLAFAVFGGACSGLTEPTSTALPSAGSSNTVSSNSPSIRTEESAQPQGTLDTEPGPEIDAREFCDALAALDLVMQEAPFGEDRPANALIEARAVIAVLPDDAPESVRSFFAFAVETVDLDLTSAADIESTKQMEALDKPAIRDYLANTCPNVSLAPAGTLALMLRDR